MTRHVPSRTLVALGVVIAVTVLAYSNSLTATFAFDDEKLLRALERSGGDFRPDWGVGSRVVAYYTFHLNYLIAGREPAVFHATNLLIHLANGLLVFVLVRSALQSRAVPLSWRERADLMALVAAALFLLHPVQTMAVTYVTQRYESLAATFSLAAVVSYARSVESRKAAAAVGWSLVATTAYLLALGCKQVAVVVPVLVLLYGIVILTYRPVWRRLFLPGVLMTGNIAVGVAILKHLATSPGKSVGLGAAGIGMWQYFVTQCRVLLTYLRLLVLPVNQTMDYDYPFITSLSNLGASAGFLLIMTLVLSAVVRMRMWRALSLFVLWFFICLTPTSSVVPVVDFINEYRLYLASLGLFALMAGALAWLHAASSGWSGRAVKVATVILLAALAMASYHRNATWRSDVLVWEDAVKKAPGKARARYNLGNAYRSAGRMGDALRSYEDAVRLNPKRSDAHNNLASSYLYFGRVEEAAESYRRAVEMDGQNYEARFNFGMTLSRLGQSREAAVHLRVFLEQAPSYYRAQKERARRVLGLASEQDGATRR